MLRRDRLLLGYVGLGMALFVTMATARAGHADETARTTSAVIAVDQHWLEAEENGDAAWLDAMLMPAYRSVGVDGKAAPKSAILAAAAKNRGSDVMKQQVVDWQKTHPVEQKVTMQGDTAVLSFYSKEGKVYSSDIFVYVDGRWRALYSQHSGLGKG